MQSRLFVVTNKPFCADFEPFAGGMCVCVVWPKPFLETGLLWMKCLFSFLSLLHVTIFSLYISLSLSPYSVHICIACLCLSCNSGWLLCCSCVMTSLADHGACNHLIFLSSLFLTIWNAVLSYKWIRREKTNSGIAYMLLGFVSLSGFSFQRLPPEGLSHWQICCRNSLDLLNMA